MEEIMRQLARFDRLSSPEEAASIWRELVRAYRGSLEQLAFARAVLTNREGMVVLLLVLQRTDADEEGSGEYFNFLFETLASRGTPEEMLACIRLGEETQVSWIEEQTCRAWTSSFPERFSVADVFGQYLVWFWPVLSQRDLSTADDVLLVLSWAYRYQGNLMPECSIDVVNVCLALLRKGHRSRAKVQPLRATAAEIRGYFGDASDAENGIVDRDVLRFLRAVLRNRDRKGEQ